MEEGGGGLYRQVRPIFHRALINELTDRVFVTVDGSPSSTSNNKPPPPKQKNASNAPPKKCSSGKDSV